MTPDSWSDENRAMRVLVAVVLAFGVAMGYLEASVVVYLRAAIESTTIGGVPDPNAFGAFQNDRDGRRWLPGRDQLPGRCDARAGR